MASVRSTHPPFPVAVIDIGSNSGRVVVLERDRAGHLRLLTGSRAPLRLVHDVDEQQSLSEESMARTMEALRDFHAIAAGVGAKRIVAVATAAMRDARNGGMFMDRIRRELRIRVEIIDGQEEARYGFAGAVRGLPVSSGLLFDLGGGSMQVSQFKLRRLARATSLPLGALRLSEKFLTSDPPRSKEVRRLRAHVWKHLQRAKVGHLGRGECLIGTGGTLRNLAKIDRNAHRYPISRLHGYTLTLERLLEIVGRIATTRQKNRDDISGLSADRADSIVGGAVAIQTLMELVRAREVLVSSQGGREGIALRLLKMAVAATKDVKEASLGSLVSRFDGWHPEAAARRRAVAAALLRASNRERIRRSPKRSTTAHGCSTSGAASISSIVMSTWRTSCWQPSSTGSRTKSSRSRRCGARRAGDRHADPEVTWQAHHPAGPGTLDRGAVILALADEIEARCPHGQAIAVKCTVGRRSGSRCRFSRPGGRATTWASGSSAHFANRWSSEPGACVRS